jgi:hypothetical protein
MWVNSSLELSRPELQRVALRSRALMPFFPFRERSYTSTAASHFPAEVQFYDHILLLQRN